MQQTKNSLRFIGLAVAAFAGGFLAQYVLNAVPATAQAQTGTNPTGWVLEGKSVEGTYGRAPVMVVPASTQVYPVDSGGITDRFLSTYLIGTPDPGGSGSYSWYSVATMTRVNVQNDLPADDAIVVRSEKFNLN